MRQDFKVHDFFVIEEDGRILGFVTLHDKSPDVSEISWLAVDPDRQREGLGTRMMDHVCRYLRDRKKKILEVKTLDPGARYEPYERTRHYYEKNGFFQMETIDPYPPWGEGNPCAIFIKIL